MAAASGASSPIILGAYELGPEIGSGAMGSVHLAHERDSRTPVAIKRIHTKYAGQKQTLRRFAIEVQTAARLRHPNIVSVVSSGSEPRGTPYCVMEWVAGRPLSSWSRKRLSWAHVAWILDDLLSALIYAHARGVVHRDLKPANLLIEDPYTRDARLRLVDFGIARLLEPEDENQTDATQLTMEDRVLGTPAYLSPEQAQGFQHLIGPHTDLYALGVILYELIAGELPFANMPVVNLLMAHATTPPPMLDLSKRPDVPRQVAQVVRRLLAKAPEDRPQSAREVREALNLDRSVPRAALPAADGDAELAAQADAAATQGEATSTRAPRLQRPALHLTFSVQGSFDAVELVGRDPEIHSLIELALRAKKESHSRWAVVHGEAGVGKSHLVQEVRYRLEELASFRGARLAMRSGPTETDAARGLLARLLMTERLEGEPLRRRLADVANRLKLDPLDVQALFTWFSEAAPSPGASDRAELGARVLRRLAVTRPLVLVVEGIDMMAPGFTVDLLSRLLLDEEDTGEVFLMTPVRTLPEAAVEPLSGLYRRLREESRADVVPLGPLPQAVLAELIRPLVPSGAERLAERAKGNPLFALELARYRAGGALATVAEAHQTMPLSIGDVWQRRIEDVLKGARDASLSRCLLTAAAILGPSVPRAHLVSAARTALSRERDEVESALDHWIQVEVLVDDGARQPSISFAHTLGFEYVTQHLRADTPDLRALMRHLSDWITGKRVGIDPDLLLRLAGILDGLNDKARAGDVRLLAGELALARLEYQRAQDILEPLARGASDSDGRSLKMRAAAELAQLHTQRRDLDAAAAILAPYKDLLSALPESAPSNQAADLVGLLRARASLALVEAKRPDAIKRLHEAAKLAKFVEDPLCLANVRAQLSNALELSGQLADAEKQGRLAVKAMEQSQASGRLRAAAYISLASLCRLQGRAAEAAEAANLAKSLAEASGDRRQLDRSLHVLLGLAADQNDSTRAANLGAKLLELHRAAGDRLGTARTLNALGVVERHRAALAKSEALHKESLAHLEKAPDPHLFAANLVNLATILRRRRSFEAAREHYDRALELLRDIGDPIGAARISVDVALLLRAKKALGEAETRARDALRFLLDQHDFTGAARAQLALGLVAADQNKWSIARELFYEARGVFADMGLYRDLMVAETWLALADLNQSQHQQAEMAGRHIAERLGENLVYKRMLAQGITRLADALRGRAQEVSWRLEERARQIVDRLEAE